jgi:uncharacterized protein YdaU (DUF1376 family)
VHYYQFNIADYRKMTAHLTLIEHAIYRSLIDTYYLQESPLLADVPKLMRSHSARSLDEKQAVTDVLEEFFVLADGYFHHVTCDKVLADIYKKSDKARASAKARWDKRDANAIRTHSDGIASGMLPINLIPINPIPKEDNADESATSPKAPTCPHSEIIAAYHECLPRLPTVLVSRWAGSSREKDLRTRWKESDRHQNIEFWKKYFTAVNSIDWYFENDRGWQPNLEWLIKRKNFDSTIDRLRNQ